MRIILLEHEGWKRNASSGNLRPFNIPQISTGDMLRGN